MAFMKKQQIDALWAHVHWLGVLADTARLTHPDKDNLFTAVEFDRVIWERVQQGADRWSRRG